MTEMPKDVMGRVPRNAPGQGGVSERLRTGRRSAGLTQTQLAEAVGVGPITVSRWERGVTTPSLQRLRGAAAATSTTVSDLLRASDVPSEYSAELASLRKDLEERASCSFGSRTLDRLA